MQDLLLLTILHANLPDLRWKNFWQIPGFWCQLPETLDLLAQESISYHVVYTWDMMGRHYYIKLQCPQGKSPNQLHNPF